jgi:hypothetical protein
VTFVMVRSCCWRGPEPRPFANVRHRGGDIVQALHDQQPIRITAAARPAKRTNVMSPLEGGERLRITQGISR